MKRLSRAGLLDALVATGDLPEAELERARALMIAAARGDEDPWYLKVLQGGGGWLASLLVLLGIVLMFSDATVIYMVLGLGAFGGGLVLDRGDSGSAFRGQLALSSCLAGLGMMAFSVAQMFDSAQLYLGTATLVAAVGIFALRDRMSRWVFSLVFLASFAGFLIRGPMPRVLWCIYLVVVATGVTFALLGERRLLSAGRRFLHGPLTEGLCWGLMGLSVAELIIPDRELALYWPISVGFTALMMVVIAQVLRDHEIESTGRAALGFHSAGLAVCACFWVSPTLIAALLLMGLAIRNQARVLLGLATVAVLGLGSYIYYDMDHS